MHSVSIDKTDGCIVYLSKECIDANIVTAKSSEMNVSIPKEDGDFVSYGCANLIRFYSFHCGLNCIHSLTYSLIQRSFAAFLYFMDVILCVSA